jgi:hypothetical protein
MDERKDRKNIERESKNDGINIFKCPNREKINELQTSLEPMLRVGTLEGSSWKENYPKTPCYFVLDDSKPKSQQSIIHSTHLAIIHP